MHRCGCRHQPRGHLLAVSGESRAARLPRLRRETASTPSAPTSSAPAMTCAPRVRRRARPDAAVLAPALRRSQPSCSRPAWPPWPPPGATTCPACRPPSTPPLAVAAVGAAWWAASRRSPGRYRGRRRWSTSSSRASCCRPRTPAVSRDPWRSSTGAWSLSGLTDRARHQPGPRRSVPVTTGRGGELPGTTVGGARPPPVLGSAARCGRPHRASANGGHAPLPLRPRIARSAR